MSVLTLIEAHIAREAQERGEPLLATTLEVSSEIARTLLGEIECPNWLEGQETSAQLLSNLVERAVNRRELGAYYTPSDVTRHIVRNTLRDLDASGSLKVLDPTCGSGAFLVAALHELAPRHARVRQLQDPSWKLWQSYRHVAANCLCGVDIVPEAIAMTALQLRFAVAHASAGEVRLSELHDIGQHLTVDDVLLGDAPPFADVDAVVGNPPFVTLSAAESAARGYEGFVTAPCRNLAALTTERALRMLRTGGRLGLVLPISTVCVDGMGALRELLRKDCSELDIAMFDTIPGTLFEGVVQRVCFVEGVRADDASAESAVVKVTKYHRWRASERSTLLDDMTYQQLPAAPTMREIFPKVGSECELQILERMAEQAPLGDMLTRSGDAPLWYKRRWSYHLFFADFVPDVFDAHGQRRMPSELKPLHITKERNRMSVLAALASSTFYWWFTVHSDNRNVNRREIERFPFAQPTSSVSSELGDLAEALMHELRTHSELRECTYASVGTITNRYFFQGRTKPVVDRIDRVLGEHYGFDAEQVAFLIGFDADYRTARELSAAAR